MSEDSHFTDGIKERLRSRMEAPSDESVTLFFNKDEYETGRRRMLSGAAGGSLNAINGSKQDTNFSASSDQLTATGQSSSSADTLPSTSHNENTDALSDARLLESTAQNTIDAEPTPVGSNESGVVSMCRYDGVEMPALDLDNIYFDVVFRQPTGNDSLAALARSVENLAEQTSSYSDNEKQLLEEVGRTMQRIDEYVVNELLSSINSNAKRLFTIS